MLGPNLQQERSMGAVSSKERRLNISSVTQLSAQDGTYYLTPQHMFVEVTCNTAMGSWSLYLPDVARAEGMVVTIKAIVGDSKNITVKDNDESLKWNDLTLGTDTDYVVLYCDGTYWHTLVNGIT